MRAAARVLDAMEPLENARQLLGGDAGTGVTNGELGFAAGVSQPHFNPAFQRELEGIGKQVQNDLLPHVAIGIGRTRGMGGGHSIVSALAERKLLASSTVYAARSVSS